MVRPCFLVIDREYASSISTRKLVIETAKFNVITSYSSAEAVSTLRRFPAVDGVVMDAGMKDMPCEELVQQLKAIHPAIIVIVVGRPGTAHCAGAAHHLESFDPKRVLALLQQLVPEETAAIELRNEILSSEE